MLSRQTTQPRYEVAEWVPIYGSRDEITGSRRFVWATAYTRRYAEHLANKCYDPDSRIEIIDRVAESVAHLPVCAAHVTDFYNSQIPF